MSIATFFKGVRTELKHVKWPTQAQTAASVAFVIIVSLLVAYYLGLLDAIFQYLLKLVVNQ